MMRATKLIAATAILLASSVALAAEGGKPPAQDWSWSGTFGNFERAQLQRGLQVYRENCAACHSLRFIAFRNLSALGYGEGEIKAFTDEYEVEDGPDDEGEMYMRPALPSDRFVPPFPNENAARASNNGALPPDLSLMTKARKGGADYLYGILVGYEDEAPAGVELADGMSYHHYFPGNQIAMPPPLFEDGVEYADGTAATVKQQAADVTAFLSWAAEPELEERKSLGIKVLIFLVIFTAMLIAVKKQVWRDVEH